jgi:hypothetical protein
MLALRADHHEGVAMPHMLCIEDHSIVVANAWGMDRTYETLITALKVIGATRSVLVCSPDYSEFPKKRPGEHIWTIDQDLTIPPHVTLFLAPNVFWDGLGHVTLWEPIIAFEDPWYRGTGVLTLIGA